ncbi:hypothetical protein A2819_00630 [Candidatus Azambacteria bacterium RIFCSPHIGHO2_01_FULL_40_24]|uniref:DUF4878 domain-containing protein n=1 Tax=Candidatus Azambacteria bacterium RIFCSPHIGHO2_01_FULL_40_24 TaxID=1797301 RepID=A0A1F5B2M4_9BACT|nr:MAG: hypothetical protein A2819_00630 [Candidatus Azambacteria bacterium RIFCSPHIGHO2_01_FULL_40_24]
MASSKGILRSVIVLISILSIGFLGLWFLSGPKISINNKNNLPIKTPVNKNITDGFSNFGGQTPQETLKLLISALEKNNLTLAAKYFIPENREVVSEDLERLNTTNLLGDLIKDLKNIKLGKLSTETHYYFEIIDETGQTAAALELIKNQKGLWKIISL